MRPVLIILVISLFALQYKLWLGDGSILHLRTLKQKLEAHEQVNEKLSARNHAIEADITELKQGEQSLEEQARYELGMVKNDESYYQFVD